VAVYSTDSDLSGVKAEILSEVRRNEEIKLPELIEHFVQTGWSADIVREALWELLDYDQVELTSDRKLIEGRAESNVAVT
jgi:hypothetical protein